MIYPLPAVMISCGETEEEYNIITISWVGTICTNPAMCYISVRPERHSYEIIKRTGEFVINLTNEELARALQKGINDLVADGTIQKIFDRYGVKYRAP